MPGDYRELDAAAAFDLLGLVECQFQHAMAACGDVVELPGFRVFFWPDPDPFYRNVAVPVTPEALDGGNIAAMKKVFDSRGRRVGLEFTAERWPNLSLCLRHHDLILSSRIPILVLQQPPALPANDDDGRVVIVDNTGATPAACTETSKLAHSYIEAANLAFTSFASERLGDESNQLCAALAGGRSLLGLVLADGEVVAGACLAGIATDAELVGVWTSPRYQRRGLAELVCRSLLRRFFSHGGRMVWLSAPDAASWALYQRLGFRFAGHQLTITSAS